jgi:CheY-like chemotaxis protein
MANYDFESLTVLLVEDSKFMRSLLTNSLRVLGVGTIITRDHGGEAIEFLKLVKEDPMKAGCQGVDIIISNWQMSPVDGMMLLRWLRRHADSPDRFIPFIMISAFSGKERVARAREMGISEFLTKPFTIKSVCDKIILTIEKQRQFVHTSSYFGPDRRRRKLEGGGKERRVLKEGMPGVEIVRG